MKKARKPTIKAITTVIIKPKSTKGCFEIIIKLDFMASIDFRFPNTISGMVKNVK